MAPLAGNPRRSGGTRRRMKDGGSADGGGVLFWWWLSAILEGVVRRTMQVTGPRPSQRYIYL